MPSYRSFIWSLIKPMTSEEQNAWAAKGGRGRKKAKLSPAWLFLTKRGKGRPKKEKTEIVDKYTGRKSWANEADFKIMHELISEAPKNPSIPVQTLVKCKVVETDFGAERKTMISNDQHVRRIMRKIRKQLSILHSPHRSFKKSIDK